MIASKLSKSVVHSLQSSLVKTAAQRANLTTVGCRAVFHLANKPTSTVSSSLTAASCTQQRSISTSSRRLNTTTTSDSLAQELFYVEDHRDQGYVVLKLNKLPANSLNLDFLTALNIQLDKLEQAKDIKGVIVTSNSPSIFSAGLDIMELFEIKPDRGRQFWSALQDFWINLYGSNKIYIAAINGHAPAGGCLLAMSCDYRIMSKGNYSIGLNETLLGIKAPFWFRDTMINTIGFRESEKALQLGKLYTPDQALAINLIDEIAEPKDLMAKAQEQMLQWVRIPTIARELTKSSMRRDTISKLVAQKEADTVNFIEFAMKDSIQKSIKSYLEALKRPRKPNA